MNAPTVIIVGASVGGVRTAQALRAADFPGRVVLVGAEDVLPYDKPALSKGLLAGISVADDITLLDEDGAHESGIELMLGRRAVRLHTAEAEVELDDGERLAFDDLVAATGASPRPCPWAAPPGVHLLRTLADATALRADLAAGGHLAVVGGGFIGAEVAATARGLGLDVTIVDPVRAPMAHLVGAEVGELFASLHARHGVRTRFGAGVEAIDGTRGTLRVTLTDGDALTASTVLVGIGAAPNDQWLASSGLTVSDGLLCDAYCRAIGAPRVHAVGDVARWWHSRHGRYIRAEHWTNAVDQAAVVAHNISHPGQLRPHSPVHYIWSDQYDWKIQIAGWTGTERYEIIGDPQAGGRFAVLYGRGSALSGLVAVNWPWALVAGRRALTSGGELAALRSALQARVSSQIASPARSSAAR